MSIRDTADYYHIVLKRIPPKAEPSFESEEMQNRVWGGPWGVTNDVGTIRVCLVHRPGNEVKLMTEDKYDPSIEALIDDEEQWYFRSDKSPDLDRMQEEHDGLVRALRAEGIQVAYVSGSPRNPKAMFARDVGMVVKGGIVIGRMGPVGTRPGTGRRGEERYAMQKVVELGMPVLRTIHGTGLFEGGSFCWLDEHHVAVGLSYRQNEEGTRQLEEVLAVQGVEVIRIPLVGHSLHLDGCIVMVDYDLALVRLSRLPYWFLDRLGELGIRTVEVDPRDNTMTTNCLAVSPGNVLMCAGSDRTADKLDKLGVDVKFLPYDEIHKNGGGIHCSTLPLVREP